MLRANVKFLAAVACMSLGMFGKIGWLHAAAYSTNATCSSLGPENWGWMSNRKGSSPCLMAAAVLQPCFTRGYNIPPLGPTNTDKYTQPTVSNDTVNKCYCSWAAYNLLEACSTCQGRADAVITWSLWFQSCGDNLTIGRAYPPEFSIPDNLTFPNWAATDPTTWEDQRFNAQEAQTIEASSALKFENAAFLFSRTLLEPGDLQDPSALLSTPNHGTNVGAIAGGVVGGVLVLAIGIAAAVFLHCRNQRKRAQQVQQAPDMSQAPLDHHVRNPSDTSTKSYGIGFGYNRLDHTSSPSNGSDSRILNSPTTFRTHNTSHGSLTHESLMGSFSYHGTPPPQPGNHLQPQVLMTAHGAVSPFTLERPSSSQGTSSIHERKRSEVSTGDGSTTAVAPRGLMNPPAYSEAPRGHADFASIAPDQASIYGSSSIMTTPPGNSSVPSHERGPSVGTIGSNASTTSAGFWTHTGTASLSGAADLLSQMEPRDVPGPPGEVPPYVGPSSDMNVPRDHKRA